MQRPSLAAAALAILGIGAPAQSPTVLLDVNQAPVPEESSLPLSFAVLGNDVLFGGTGRGVGRELWALDRTTHSARLVADIVPGSGDSNPYYLTAIGNVVVFGATHPTLGNELFVSDGTETGTGILVDIVPGPGPSVPREFVPFGGAVCFAAASGLWRTDGTAAGTWRLHQFQSMPTEFTALGGHLYFRGHESATGLELWRTDGTTAGTTLIADIQAGSDHGYPTQFAALGNRVLFRADDGVNGAELWHTDGTTTGTTIFFEVHPGTNLGSGPSNLTTIGSQVFFSVATSLWRTDGTSPGTVEIATPAVPFYRSALFGLVEVGGRCVFRVTDAFGIATGVWVSDGTAAGTMPLLPTPALSVSGVSGRLGGRLLFDAAPMGSVTGNELYVTDGTVAGTNLVRDINAGPGSSNPASFGGNLADGRVLFAADDGVEGVEVWATDATLAGTTLVADVHDMAGVTEDSNSSSFADCLGVTYFAATDAYSNFELWSTDGTAAGTRLAVDLDPSGSSDVHYVRAVGDRVYFLASTPATGRELWVSDGTPAGTQVIDVYPGPDGSNPSVLTPVGGRMFFLAYEPNTGREMYVTDGTPGGTTLLTEALWPGPFSSPVAEWLRPFGDAVLFRAFMSGSGVEPFVTDGTVAGTRSLGDLRPGFFGSEPEGFTVLGDRAFFGANDGPHGYELWQTDGTAAGTTMFLELRPGADSSAPEDLMRVGDRMFFTATDGVHGHEVWVTDGTVAGTRLAGEVNPGPGGASVWMEAALGDLALFVAADPVNGRELWRSDGTPAGTFMLGDINPGLGSADVLTVVPSGSRYAWFRANDGGPTGVELWRTDGTVAGTIRVSDLAPGLESGNPLDLTIAEGRLLFRADHPDFGWEPWILADLGASATPVGYGCSAGIAPRLTATDPVLGSTFTMHIDRTPPASVGLLLLGWPTPVSWRTHGCDFFIDPNFVVLTPFAGTGGSWSLQIPLQLPAALSGLRLRLQAALGPTSHGIDTTNAVSLTFGQ